MGRRESIRLSRIDRGTTAMYDSHLWAEMILEQKILHAANQPTSTALIPFGAHDQLTEADVRHALDSTDAGMHRAVLLLAIEYGYPEENTTFEQLRTQLLGGPADRPARNEPGLRVSAPARPWVFV